MNGEYLDVSINEVPLTEAEKKKRYMKEWREKHKEHIRAYNKQHHIQIRQEASDTYYIVSELRALRRLVEAPADKSKELMDTITNYMAEMREENQSLKKYVNDLLKETDELKKNAFSNTKEDRTPTQSPVPQIYQPPQYIPPPIQEPVKFTEHKLETFEEPKKIKKVRKIKPKSSIKPPSPTSSEASSVTPVKITKNMINEMLEDLIDSDGNIIPSETETETDY